MKKIVKVTFVVAFAAIAGYGVSANQKAGAMSDLLLANVEALARYEINPDCPNGCTSASSYCRCYQIHPNMREVHWQ